jgi:hypothetical protein
MRGVALLATYTSTAHEAAVSLVRTCGEPVAK